MISDNQESPQPGSLIQEGEATTDPQFQSLVETALDIVAVLNHDGSFRYLSPAVARITGYGPNELVGQNAFALMHVDDADEQLEVFKAVVSDPGRPTQGVPHSFRFRHKDGHWVVLESVSSKLPDDSAAPGIMVNVRDVTERTRAHDTLRELAESERQYAQEHEIIAEVGRIINSNLNIEEVFELFAAELRRLIGFDMVAASIVDSSSKTTTLKYWSGPEEYRENFQSTVPLSGSFTGQVVAARKPVIIQEGADETSAPNVAHPAGGHHNKVLSRLGLPMVNRGKIIGALLLFSSDPLAFSDLDVSMAQRVCYQIAGAIENAQLFDQLRVAESELAGSAAEKAKVASQNQVIAEIGRIISSTLNIYEVYEPFADQVRKLINYDVLGIAVLNPDGQSFRMAHRVGDHLLGKTIGSQIPVVGTIIGEVSKTRKSKIVQGFSQSELAGPYPVIVSTYESGVRSWLCVPLVNKGEFVGTILVHSRVENAFVESDIELVQRVGNQIAGAIHNGELFEELKTLQTQLAGSVMERTEVANQSGVIAEIGRIISSTLDIDEVYELFADQVRKLIDYDVLGIGVVAEKGRTLRIAHRVGDNLLGKTVGELIPFDGTLTGDVSKSDGPLIIQGSGRDVIQTRYPVAVPTYDSGVRSWLCVPLISRSEFVGTLLVLSRQENAFHEQDIELAQRVGNQIAGAIGGAETFADLKRTETELAGSIEQRTLVARQNEVLAEISRIISSTLDIDEVFESFANQVGSLIGFDVMAIGFLEGNGGSGRISHRTGDRIGNIIIGSPVPEKGSLTGVVAKTRQTKVIQGVTKEELESELPYLVNGYDSGLRSWLCSPMINRGDFVGSLLILSKSEHAYTELDSTLAQRIANQIAGAMDSVRLYGDLKQAETDLADSIDRNQMILDTAHDAFVSIDDRGEVTSWNSQAEQTFGWSAGEAVRRQISDLIIPERFADQHINGLKEFSAPKGSSILNQRIELIAKHRDGHEFPVEITIAPLKLGDRHYFNAFILDITERQLLEKGIAETNETLVKANQELQELDKLKDEFISTVSHELRTPLTSIKGSAEILLTYGDEDRETQLSFLRIINKECDRLTRLVTDVLDLSRMESRQMRWSWETLVLGDVVAAAVDGAQSLLIRKELSVHVNLDSDLPQLWNDRDRLAQVVTNLLSNAIKFTSPGGDIWIKARKLVADPSDKLGEKLEICVSDTGVGIQVAEYGNIFQKFRQVGDSLVEKPTGTGLGLAICREIVEFLGGEIWVESVPGEGSHFYFTVPVSAKEQAPEPEQAYSGSD